MRYLLLEANTYSAGRSIAKKRGGNEQLKMREASYFGKKRFSGSPSFLRLHGRAVAANSIFLQRGTGGPPKIVSKRLREPQMTSSTRKWHFDSILGLRDQFDEFL